MVAYTDFASVLKHPDRFFIDGEWMQPTTNAQIKVISPASEEHFYSVAEAAADDIERAIVAARKAFDEGPWPRLSHAERADYLRKMAQELRARASELAGIWAGEMGSLYAANTNIIPIFAGVYDFHANMADTFPFIEPHQPAQGGAGYLVREPVGVVAAIVPWNGPLMLASWKIAPALLAGCTVILKASPEAPGTLLVLGEIAEAIGLPKGVLNVVTAEREVSELLVRDRRVDKVSFTGSTAAGRKIGSICGDRIARCTLELGGKSPAILLDDYDVGAFAQTIAASTTILTGQVCAALTRIIVSRSRHDELADALKSQLDKVNVGDPFDPSTQMGPLAMQRQRDKVEHYIKCGQADGAKLVTGGRRPAHLGRGYYIEPTLFANVDNDATIAREEIFGPVLSLIPADDERHAVQIANDTDYGLNASVFTNDPERAFSVARQVRSGTVAHNAFRNDFTIAFGGFKQSGIGREGGTEGLMNYLETKTILLQSPVDVTTPAAVDA
ncbi:MAG: aldehyde dehydrogenase [Alphaproteobacteria bacterium]|nr:aldehyde dehydrogenase [Alphaproteobacteria bacterium]